MTNLLISIPYMHSSSTRSVPFFSRLTASLSVFKQSNSNETESRRESSSKSIHHEPCNKISQLSDVIEPKPLCPQNTLPLNRKSELALPGTSETILPVPKKSKEHTKSQKPKSLPLPCFELTPLSHLIKQSYRDIEQLQQVRAAENSNYGEDLDNGQKSLNLSCGIPANGEEGKEVDFNKVKENLMKFEELYSKFLNQARDEFEKSEEVHLVAVVCKRSQVITGFLKAPISDPKH